MVDSRNESPTLLSANASSSAGGIRASISRGVVRATSHLLRAGEGDEAVQTALGWIGEAFGAGGARIFEYRSEENGEQPLLRCSWTAAGETSESRNGQEETPLTLTLPIAGAEGTWGKLLLETDDPEVQWTREEVALLEMTAANFGAVLSGDPVPTGSAVSLGDASPQASAPEAASGTKTPDGQEAAPPSLDLQRRVRAERALVEASKLLVSSEACDYERLLEIVGEATEARYAYLVVITPSDVVSYPDDTTAAFDRDQPIQLDTYTQYEWYDGHASRDADEAGPTFAVPILSSGDQLFGYVGIEYKTASGQCRDEDARILSVLGDMLCSYLQRQISEEALRRSEQRYRYFVDTISEAIWRVDLTTPIDTEAPAEEQVEALLSEGVVGECNEAMAKLFRLKRPNQLVGQTVGRLVNVAGRQIVEDLISAGYRLRQHEYVVRAGSARERHFVINTVGVREDGRLTSLWGSCTEVTERVELERRMVASLERQQQRIGRDLHDRVGQQLAGTRMLAQNLADRHFPDDDQPGRKMIDRIVSYVQEATQHVNDLQRGVMPVQVERDGLAQALVELASRTDMLADVSCVYTHDGTTDVRHQETKLQLYRIAQEATRNALTHADPSRIDVELYAEDDDVVVCVSDDGAGFEGPDSQPKESSFGLHSMRYRARSIGASLTIETAPGEGTIVICRVPQSRAGGRGMGDE
jgi:signal transduction histidine kinase